MGGYRDLPQEPRRREIRPQRLRQLVEQVPVETSNSRQLGWCRAGLAAISSSPLSDHLPFLDLNTFDPTILHRHCHDPPSSTSRDTDYDLRLHEARHVRERSERFSYGSTSRLYVSERVYQPQPTSTLRTLYPFHHSLAVRLSSYSNYFSFHLPFSMLLSLSNLSPCLIPPTTCQIYRYLARSSPPWPLRRSHG